MGLGIEWNMSAVAGAGPSVGVTPDQKLVILALNFGDGSCAGDGPIAFIVVGDDIVRLLEGGLVYFTCF